MEHTINILLLFLAGIVLVLAIFLLKNRARPFLIFHPEKERGLALFCTYFGTFMLLCSLLTILAIFLNVNWLLLTIVFLDVLCSFIVPFVLWAYTL